MFATSSFFSVLLLVRAKESRFGDAGGAGREPCLATAGQRALQLHGRGSGRGGFSLDNGHPSLLLRASVWGGFMVFM